jgi:hypothetical protein
MVMYTVIDKIEDIICDTLNLIAKKYAIEITAISEVKGCKICLNAFKLCSFIK